LRLHLELSGQKDLPHRPPEGIFRKYILINVGGNRLRIGHGLAAFLVAASLGMPVAAQPPSEIPAVMTLATGRLASVVGLPFFFRLYQVHLPAARHASYQGSSAMLYDLSGAVALAIEGRAAQRLDEGAGVFIAAGQEVTINASVSEPAAFLLFLLTTRPNQRRPLLDLPAVTRELYRTPYCERAAQRSKRRGHEIKKRRMPAGREVLEVL
jgi:hypothetical protein